MWVLVAYTGSPATSTSSNPSRKHRSAEDRVELEGGAAPRDVAVGSVTRRLKPPCFAPLLTASTVLAVP